MLQTKIIGTGAYIPELIIPNEHFAEHEFYTMDSESYPYSNDQITQKFEAITGIRERRYVTDDLVNSDIGAMAGAEAIKDSGIDPESLNMIIAAHNFGDVQAGSIQSDSVPSLAARIKYLLKIENPACMAFDVLYGCPGWIQSMIIANAFIQSGQAKRCLVIGLETLSRVIDPNDRDSMIYSDGAGACVVEASDEPGGILSTASASHTVKEMQYLFMGKGNAPEADPHVRYLKMHGRKIYEHALTEVPAALKTCLDKTGLPIDEVKMIFLHQANEKMDEAIIQRFYKLYGKKPGPKVMPMSIGMLGNSSVATVPTLYHLVSKGQMEGYELEKGDLVLFASVGAGMHINAFTYRV